MLKVPWLVFTNSAYILLHKKLLITSAHGPSNEPLNVNSEESSAQLFTAKIFPNLKQGGLHRTRTV